MKSETLLAIIQPSLALRLMRKVFPGFRHLHKLRTVTFRMDRARERAAFLRMLAVVVAGLQFIRPQKNPGSIAPGIVTIGIENAILTLRYFSITRNYSAISYKASPYATVP